MKRLDKRIVFTGGGSAGHVTVNLALIPHFIEEGWEVVYIGSHHGIESELVKRVAHVKYISITTGKWRRYRDMENMKDPFRVMKGVMEAAILIRRLKPQVVFSKGGFVSVPVVIGAWLNRVPVIIHESDITPGLANRLSIPFASKVCTTFSEAASSIKDSKAVHVGAIIRESLQHGSVGKGYAYAQFTSTKPVMLVMGGSLGSERMNGIIRHNLDELLESYQVMHLCGKGQLDPSIKRYGYKQVEYVQEELPHLLAMTSVVVSRAGSNAIFEFLALHKPMLLIPLTKAVSRGDQILNAESFRASGFAEVLYEEQLNNETFMNAVYQLKEHASEMVDRMKQIDTGDRAIQQVVKLIMNEE